MAPAGLRVCFHSKLSRLLKYSDDQRVGACVHAPQKNIGPSGIAIVIVRKTLLEREGLAKPGILAIYSTFGTK